MVDFPGTTPNRITYAQAMGLWIKAGGPKAVAPVAAAIAEAESGLDANQYNPTDNGGTQTSWGLWQVSKGTHASYPNWNDPLTNAKYAVAKYKGAGNAFTPWGTYDSGAYRAFLGGGTPDPNTPGQKGSPGAGNGGDQATLTAATGDECLIGTPNVNPIPTFVPIIGKSTQFCLLTKVQGRQVMGALVLLGGAIIGAGAVLVLVATGLRTGAARRAEGALDGSLAVLPSALGRDTARDGLRRGSARARGEQ